MSLSNLFISLQAFVKCNNESVGRSLKLIKPALLAGALKPGPDPVSALFYFEPLHQNRLIDHVLSYASSDAD